MDFMDDAITGARAGYNNVEGGAPGTAGGVAGALTGILGRYAMAPIESLQALGNSMQSAYEGRGYDPAAVTSALMDVGMLSSPVNSVLMPKGSLGMFGGKLGKAAKNVEFGPLDYWLPLDHPDRAANFEKWVRNSLIAGGDTGELKPFFASGTNKPLFKAFDVRHSGSNTGNADAVDFAAWLSDQMKIPSDYANGRKFDDLAKRIRTDELPGGEFPRIMPGYVRAENPFIYDMKSQRYNKGLFNELAQEARKPEYDALFVKNVKDGIYDTDAVGNVIAIKYPNQFKSLWNSGEFGETDDFMRATVPTIPHLKIEKRDLQDSVPATPESYAYDELLNHFGML